jgi:hypothetical protein
MWVDGVLDPERLNQLSTEAGVTVEQHETYLLAYFYRFPKRYSYRYLDPHRYVLQRNQACTELEINFNPSPKEVADLRAFLYSTYTRLLNCK